MNDVTKASNHSKNICRPQDKARTTLEMDETFNIAFFWGEGGGVNVILQKMSIFEQLKNKLLINSEII